MNDNQKPPVRLDLDQWTDRFSKHLADEVFRLVNAQRKLIEPKFGPQAIERLYFNFVAALIAGLVYKTLKAPKSPSLTQEQIMKITMSDFGLVKNNLQEAVAAGFQGAMQTFAGKPIEYYCQVVPVSAELGNKKPC